MTVLTGVFLDTSDVRTVQQYHALGIVRGVTTNPTILVQGGVGDGWAGMEARCTEIARLVHPWPVSVEVTTNDPEEMMEQAPDPRRSWKACPWRVRMAPGVALPRAEKSASSRGSWRASRPGEE